MRESNFSSPAQNRACVCITSALYDRRAIDAPSPSLPLVNSLTHLSYLTATSPRIREILSMDGGLERLVRILKHCAATASASTYGSNFQTQPTLRELKGREDLVGRGPLVSPFRSFVSHASQLTPFASPNPSSRFAKNLLYTYTLAFQCIVNIGVRGSEQIRTRVVEAGALDVVVHVLEKYLERISKERKRPTDRDNNRFVEIDSNVEITQKGRAVTPLDDHTVTGAKNDGDGDVGMEVDDAAQQSSSNVGSESVRGRSPPPAEVLQFRDEDVLLSLQLLAYLSKYPHVRTVFHSPTDLGAYDHIDSYPPTEDGIDKSIPAPPPPTISSNVFSLVEAFTHRPANDDRHAHSHSHEVQYWAGVIMRNACRKDESKGGIRQCANMQCGVWEKQAREFAKCRRCRKAKYCSKSCQSKAWQLGHRYWCAKATPKENVGTAASSSVEDVRAGGDEDMAQGTSSRTARSERSHGHHFRHPHRPDIPSRTSHVPRTGTTTESNDDDDDAQDENLPPPAGRRHSVHPHRQSFDTVEVGGMHVGEGAMGLDENEVAQEMMGGGVFGEHLNTRPGME